MLGRSGGALVSSQVLSLCTVSVARQRRRVRGITRNSATIKSCMPYVTKNSLIFFFAGDDLGAVFLGASTELSEVTERRMATRASSWKGAHTCSPLGLASAPWLLWVLHWGCSGCRGGRGGGGGIRHPSSSVSQQQFLAKRENLHLFALLSVFPWLSVSYLFSCPFCIFPSQPI